MRLRQVLLNLADTAVKYNVREGSIEMALQRLGDEAVFAIRNTGSALAPDLEALVFERFFRGVPAHGGAIVGSGLGLSIVKSIVEAHGGTIAYEVLPDGRTQVTVALSVVLPS
jgi:signal transduction histidine kinase